MSTSKKTLQVLVSSDGESSKLLDEIIEDLELHGVHPRIGESGPIPFEKDALDSLKEFSKEIDAAIFIFPTEKDKSAQTENPNSIIDNFDFKAGYFVSKLGDDKCFFLIPQNEASANVTYFNGFRTGTYDPSNPKLETSISKSFGSIIEKLKQAKS